MDDNARVFAKKLFEEGKSHIDIRNALISNGYSTAGFEDEYQNILKELGISEPQTPKNITQKKQNRGRDESSKDVSVNDSHHTKRWFTNIAKLAGAALIIVVVAVLFFEYKDALKTKIFGTYQSQIQGEGLKPTDFTHVTQLQSMQTSAQIYKNKLTDYIGVCDSIGIDKTQYTCNEGSNWYLIEVQLSNDSYYCVDHTGFDGVIPLSRRGMSSCQ